MSMRRKMGQCHLSIRNIGLGTRNNIRALIAIEESGDVVEVGIGDDISTRSKECHAESLARALIVISAGDNACSHPLSLWVANINRSVSQFFLLHSSTKLSPVYSLYAGTDLLSRPRGTSDPALVAAGRLKLRGMWACRQLQMGCRRDGRNLLVRFQQSTCHVPPLPSLAVQMSGTQVLDPDK